MRSWRQLRGRKFPAALVCLTGILALTNGTWAAERLPATIDGGLGYLYEFADPQTNKPFEAQRLDKLMAFILTPREDGATSAGRDGLFLDPLAYHEFTVKRSLPFVLGYVHNPGLPPHILTLGTVRYANWTAFDGRYPDQSDILERMASLETPLVIRGFEHEEIAPDPSSGAYYSYDLRRTLIGFRHGKYSIWMSMARQQDPSDVGRKGYVLDEKNAWHYIYSGEKGITKTGLGWVDSYMYEGFTCSFYIQADDTPDQVKVAIFKWLRAGWNGMNFVRYKHIRDGLTRFGAIMRQIIENPNLPPPVQIQSVWRQIDGLPLDQLRQINRDYLLALAKHYGKKGTFPRRWFKKQVLKGDYVNQLTPPQLKAVVFLEYMKGTLGMNPATGPEILLSYLKPAEP